MLKNRLLIRVSFFGFMFYYGVTDVWGMTESLSESGIRRRVALADITESSTLKEKTKHPKSSRRRIKRSVSPVYDRAEILPPHIYALRSTQPDVMELIFTHVEGHIPHKNELTTRWFLTEPYDDYCSVLLRILTQFNDSDERSYFLGLVNEETALIKKNHGRLSECLALVRDLSESTLEEKQIAIRLAKEWKIKHPLIPFDIERICYLLQLLPVLWMNFYDDMASYFCGVTYSALASYQAEKILESKALPLVIPVVQECMREWGDLDIDVPPYIRLLHLIHIFSKMHDDQREYKKKLFEILTHTQGRRERSYVWTEFYNCTHNQAMKPADFQQVIDRALDIQKLMPEVETGADWPNVRKFLYLMNQLPNHQGILGEELYTALSKAKDHKRQKLLDSVYDYALDNSEESSKLPVRRCILKLELYAVLKKVKEDRERQALDLAYTDFESNTTEN